MNRHSPDVPWNGADNIKRRDPKEAIGGLRTFPVVPNDVRFSNLAISIGILIHSSRREGAFGRPNRRVMAVKEFECHKAHDAAVATPET